MNMIYLFIGFFLGVGFSLMFYHATIQSKKSSRDLKMVIEERGSVVNSFDILDFHDEVYRVILLLRFNPDEWEFINTELHHLKEDIVISGSNSYQDVYFKDKARKEFKLSYMEKKALHYCCCNVKKWHNQIEEEINYMIENKFVI